MAKSTESEQGIEQLRERYARLNTIRIEVQTKRDVALKRLEELKQQATEQFGTADIAELRQKLGEIKTRNQQQQAEYRERLEAIEQKLRQIDAGFDDSEAQEQEVQEQE